MTFETFRKSHAFYRIAESIVPILTWIIITFPIWLSPFHPAMASYLILAYLLYFLYKSARTVYFAAVSFKLVKEVEKVRWEKKASRHKGFSRLHHFIIIANYKESVAKISHTIDKLAAQTVNKDKIHIILAMEEREGANAHRRGHELAQKYKGVFAGFETAFHLLIEGEVVGKASNEAFAAKYVSKKIRKLGIDPRDVIITVSDADSLLHKEYLAYVSLRFLQDKDRLYRFYWAPVLLYNNFWKLILPIRVQTILSSIIRLSILSQKDILIQISTYSTNLWLLESVGYWHTDIIPEDWHIYLQAFFKYGEKVQTIPVYLPITRDGVYAKGILKTFKTRYEQERRWAWGASDIPYAIVKFFDSSHIPVLKKLRMLFTISEAHLLWPTSFFILTISGTIPPLVNPVFARTVMGFILPRLSSAILTGTSLLLLAIIYFDHKMREKVKVQTPMKNVPMMFIQWLFLPVISLFFSSLPALEAHTRLLLGKKIEYKVTEKV